MIQSTEARDGAPLKLARCGWLACAALALLLPWLGAANAHAASAYRCVDAQGHLAYQDTPCAAQARQREIDLHPQSLIGAPGKHAAPAAPTMHPRNAARSRKHATRTRRAEPAMSWECRAANGEVFYRHTRCPSSVAGDGVVRSGHAEETSSSRKRSRHDAWSRVPVHGKKVTRSEACRRIHSAGAAGRDGHARDETVSTYDRLMGRGPCDAD